jgi:RNA polymerase sigma-70 factor (ECF subfamily)
MKDEEFAAIFNQHKDAVYRFAWRMSNSCATAEDVTQDVFFALLRGDIGVDESRGSLRSLLLGTARHFIWKRWRHDLRWSPLTEDSFVAQPLPFKMDGREEAVSAAVNSLPALQREALILATYNELSLREIAEALGVEIGTVKARLHRARENLKRILSAYSATGIRSLGAYGTHD